MKAVLALAHGGPDVLAAKDVAEPRPGPGQVLVRVRATSVNFADIKARIGGYRGDEPPFIPGLDAAGTVEELGPDVTGLEPGQRVAAYTSGGSYCELALADAVTCYPLPEAVGFEEGAAIGIGITAHNVLRWAGRLEPGEAVLVHAGAGGVGSLAVQLAGILGAGRVIATVGSDEKKKMALACGADEVINYRDEDFVPRVMAITQEKGADLVLDAIAGENAEKSMACLAEFGRLVVYGHAGAAGEFDTKQLHGHNRAVIGYSSGGYRKHRPEKLRESATAVLELLASKRLKVHVGARFELAQAAEAHRLVESRKSVGKVILLP